ncbi:MAG: glycerol-3-phosphate 1-O-acyltransferase PlsY [Eubacterium sp.]
MKLVIICVVIAAISYLLGSLNFGIIISKRIQHDDVRTHGSGNAGTTNMMRNYGKIWGILTIIGDMAKVGVAIAIAYLIINLSNQIVSVYAVFGTNSDTIIKSFAGIFCVMGHIFPCFFNFKGGKGVATCGGMCFIIDWRIALILLAMFAVTVIFTKYVSLGSIIMAIFFPVFMYVFHRSVAIAIIALVFSVIVIIAHRENIKRLINHTESKIGSNKK